MYVSDSCIVDVTNVTFNLNTAQGVCGAILVETFSTISVESCTFSNNFARDAGGALCGYRSVDVHVYNSIFTNNSVSAGPGGDVDIGGRSSLHIFGCLLVNNKAGSQGGSIQVNSESEVIIFQVTFESNIARAAGVILLSESILQVTDVIFGRNTGEEESGVLKAQFNCLVNIKDSYFYESKVPRGQAGALQAVQNTTVILDNITMIHHDANTLSGVLLLNSESSLFPSNSYIYDSYAGIDAGVIHVDVNCLFVAMNSIFEDSVAGQYGGCIQVEDQAEICLDNCVEEVQSEYRWRDNERVSIIEVIRRYIHKQQCTKWARYILCNK